MADHVDPILRDAQKALDKANVPSKLNLNRNYPTFAKELVFGNDQTMRLKRSVLRVERSAGKFKVMAQGIASPPEPVETDAEGVRAAIRTAFQILFEDWRGVHKRA
ncbi:MAG: hypothetical protein QOJ91_1202, partial [Sphingomonadales bacterium]|nr:hypothetical protein [Sphingomonadales bacterium]